MDDRIPIALVSRLIRFLPEHAFIESLQSHGFSTEAEDLEGQDFFTRRDVFILHDLSRKEGKGQIVSILLADTRLRGMFSFLPNAPSREPFMSMPLPMVETEDKTPEQIFELYFSKVFPPEAVELFKSSLSEHGTKALNNLMHLKWYAKDYKGHYSDFFKLDHCREICNFEYHPIFIHRQILKHYSLKRLFRLMVDTTGFDDFSAFTLSDHFNRLVGRPQKDIKQVLPKRPRSLQELYKKVDDRIQPILFKQVELKQKIEHLDEALVCGYKVEVPKVSEDLIQISKELQVCTDKYIERVLKGWSQILVLKKNDERQLVVELQENQDGFRIKQVKGLENDDSMEGPEGIYLRSSILLQVNSQKNERKLCHT
ncbi:MAG: PcfJ domain-containing protein [Bacteriovoracaceae bacterium]|nr:PcfJ domain-containing protein [Bacteriovoracaceae bacterium]